MSAGRPFRVALFVLVLGTWCGFVSGFHRSTAGALATWCVSFLTVVGIDQLLDRGRRGLRLALRLPAAKRSWPPGPQGAGSGRILLGISPWLILLIVIVVWEVLGIDTGRHSAHLTISALAQAFRAINAALLFVWIFVGIGYGISRARTPFDDDSLPRDDDVSGVAFSSAATAVALRPESPVLGLLLPNSRAAGVAFWVGWVGACVLADVTARIVKGRLATAEEFLRLVSRPLAVRLIFVAAWTFAGWHLFAY